MGMTWCRFVCRTALALALGFVCAVTFAGERVPTDPIPGVDVKVGKVPPGGGIIVAQGTTDDKGNCSFTDLPAGTYFLKFSVAGKKYKVSTDNAGDKITILSPTSDQGDSRSRIAVKPVVYVKNSGDVTVTIEITGNSLRSNLNLSKSNVDRTRTSASRPD